jgi:hypothetical protein
VPIFDRDGRAEQIRGRGRLWPGVSGVIRGDQWPRIGSDGMSDGADVPPGVEVPAASAIVVVLDAADDGFPDAGLLADLGHGETGPAARFRQVFADAHAAPPPPDRIARRTRHEYSSLLLHHRSL